MDKPRKNRSFDLEKIKIDVPEVEPALGIPLMEEKTTSPSLKHHQNKKAQKEESHSWVRTTVRLSQHLVEKLEALYLLAGMVRKKNEILNRLIEAGLDAIGKDLEKELREEVEKLMSAAQPNKQ